MDPWDQLSDRSKNTIVTASSTNQDELNTLRKKDLVDAVKEAKFTGYDDANQGAYKALEFELEQRDKKRNWGLAIITGAAAIAGVLISFL